MSQHSPLTLQCSVMKYVLLCEDYCLLGCDAVFSDRNFPVVQKNLLP
jgi:hypothetical protein